MEVVPSSCQGFHDGPDCRRPKRKNDVLPAPYENSIIRGVLYRINTQ